MNQTSWTCIDNKATVKTIMVQSITPYHVPYISTYEINAGNNENDDLLQDAMLLK